jgi:glycosyltransferase involved in cell wall biosynthesis
MKIAMIGQKGVPALHGGIERHVHELSLCLVERGFDVLAYCRKWYTQRENGLFEGVELVHVPTLHSKHLDTIVSTFFATLDAMRRRVDVIHYHGVGPSLLSWIPRVFAPRILIVSTFHSIDRKHQKWGLFARLMLRLGEWACSNFSHKTIAVSRTIFQYMRDVYDRESAYIPNAVPLYEPLKNENVLEQWNLKEKEYVLVVSRLIPHKGIHYIVEAWKKIMETKPEILGNKNW